MTIDFNQNKYHKIVIIIANLPTEKKAKPCSIRIQIYKINLNVSNFLGM